MRKMITLDKLDELLEDYKKMRNKGESFSEFVEVSGCIEDDGFKTFDWDWVSEAGIVTKADFLNVFNKEFVEENFDDLAHDWFKGLDGQIDFGVLLDCVKDSWTDRYKKKVGDK